MTTARQSPDIANIEWGQITVSGADGRHAYKDAKLWPGGSREWDWNETGTRHVPGIQTADVRELVEHGAQTVILSKGMTERLEVDPDTLEWLEEQGSTAHVLETNQAVERYNQLAGDEPVGALIHSTC